MNFENPDLSTVGGRNAARVLADEKLAAQNAADIQLFGNLWDRVWKHTPQQKEKIKKAVVAKVTTENRLKDENFSMYERMQNRIILTLKAAGLV